MMMTLQGLAVTVTIYFTVIIQLIITQNQSVANLQKKGSQNKLKFGNSDFLAFPHTKKEEDMSVCPSIN